MIKIYAPASIGNINVGFDVLGIAISPISGLPLGDTISVEKSHSFQLIHTGYFTNMLPSSLKENIVYHCWKKFCKKINQKLLIKIVLEKNMPVSSGLGSSACSIVASLVAMNEFCKKPLNNHQLLSMMGKLEGKLSGEVHYDNVAPSFLGGLQLILNKNKIISQRIPTFENWFWIIAYPGTKISTSEARSILPKSFSKKKCLEYGKNLAGFIHACYTKQFFLATKFMKDVIAEPYRIKFIPKFLKIRQELKNIGALAFGISGSGPTVFALCKSYIHGKNIEKWLNQNFIQNSSGFVHICYSDLKGTHKI